MTDRVWHHWELWECVKAGMYLSHSKTKSIEEGRASYCDFFRSGLFENSISRFNEWPISCEQFLSNVGGSFNRVAWIGQAAACIEQGIPRVCRGGFMMLSDYEQDFNNELAAKQLRVWETTYKKKNRGLHKNVEEPWVRRGNFRRSSRPVDEREIGSFIQGYLFSVVE